MANVWAWLLGNWQTVIVDLLLVDATLITIFPKVTLFAKIKDLLAPIAPKA